MATNLGLKICCLLAIFITVLSGTMHRKEYNGQRVGMGPNDEDAPLTAEDRQESVTQFFNDWSQYMADFVATEIVNFEIGAGDRKVFFETIDKVPAVIRGAYTVSAEKRNRIIFTIYDPANNIIMAKSKLKEAIIFIQVNTTGTYLFEFANRNVHFAYVSK